MQSLVNIMMWSIEDDNNKPPVSKFTKNGKLKKKKEFKDNICYVCGDKVSSPKSRQNAKDHICSKCTTEKQRIARRNKRAKEMDSVPRY